MQVIALICIVQSVSFGLSKADYMDGNDIGRSDDQDPCEGLTYCTIKPDDFPEEQFNEMFKNYKALSQPNPVPEAAVEGRLGDVGDKDNCDSRVEYSPLYKVRERREDAWRLVLQVPKINFQQTVRLEICQNEGAKCFTAFPPAAEYETFCKQKYETWNILVVTDDHKVEMIKPQLPVCCSCYYRPISFVESK